MHNGKAKNANLVGEHLQIKEEKKKKKKKERKKRKEGEDRTGEWKGKWICEGSRYAPFSF
jgi:hypothetical protein